MTALYSPRLDARHRVRVRLEAAIEKAIAALDAFDGDSDCEDSGDGEPWLGSPNALGRHGQEHWAASATNDAEEQCEDEGGQCDDEGVSGYNDPDLEPDADREPDDEPLCNWQDEGDQTALQRHSVYCRPPRPQRSPHQNVGEFIPVRVLPSSPSQIR